MSEGLSVHTGSFFRWFFNDTSYFYMFPSKGIRKTLLFQRDFEHWDSLLLKCQIYPPKSYNVNLRSQMQFKPILYPLEWYRYWMLMVLCMWPYVRFKWTYPVLIRPIGLIMLNMLVWIDLTNQMIMDFWRNLSRTLYICDSRCTKNKNEDSSLWRKVNLHSCYQKSG